MMCVNFADSRLPELFGAERKHGESARSSVAGARVIVDDIYYLTEPWFQDSVVAQAINNVTMSANYPNPIL
jgi:hypothetical protein